MHRDGQEQISGREKEYEEQERQRSRPESGQRALVQVTKGEYGTSYSDRSCEAKVPGRTLKIPEEETAEDAFLANARSQRYEHPPQSLRLIPRKSVTQLPSACLTANAFVGIRARTAGKAIMQSETSTKIAMIGACGIHFAALELGETFHRPGRLMMAAAHAVASQCPAMISV